MFVMKKYVVVALVSLLFVSCSSSRQSDLAGSWVMPVPGQPGKVQGIRLEEDGKASSINMATLVYEGWKRDGDVLTVSGKSIGNGQTLSFEEKFRIAGFSDSGHAQGNVHSLQEVPVTVLVPEKGSMFLRAKDGTLLFRYKES